MHDINVIGTLQLLAACERVPTLRTIVVRGSAGVYGAEPHAPQFFNEEMTRLFPLRTRFQRDVAEIENYFETYARRHPGVSCTMLRYQPAIGRGLRTQITRYLSQPVCPTYMGFDPRIQLVDIDDASRRSSAAVRNPVRGAVNVAGPGTIGLARMIRLAGRAALPIAAPLFGAVTSPASGSASTPSPRTSSGCSGTGAAVDTRRLTEEVGLHAAPLDRPRGRGGRRRRRRRRERRARDRLHAPRCAPGSTRARAARGAHPRRDRAPARRARDLERIVDRLDGDYHEDEWGFDEDFAELVEPFFGFLYDTWWRVKVEGAERVPAHGRALLTANHAGILPWDATMISMALLREHPLRATRASSC